MPVSISLEVSIPLAGVSFMCVFLCLKTESSANFFSWKCFIFHVSGGEVDARRG